MESKKLAIFQRSYASSSISHVHGVHQLVLPITGQIEIKLEGKSGLVKDGIFAVVGAGKWHETLGRLEDQDNQLLVIDLAPELLEQVAEELGYIQYNEKNFTPLSFLTMDEGAKSLAGLINYELGQSGLHYNLLIDSLARYVGGFVLRALFFWPAEKVQVTCSEDKRIKEVLAYIRENYWEDLSVAHLAELIGVSPSQFHRLFRHTVGTTPLYYLNGIRIEAAKKLLLETSKSVLDVCYEVGFASPSYFTRLFRKMVGQSPAGFLKNNRGIAESG